MKHVAIYVRVSKHNGQDVRSQLPDLEHYAAGKQAAMVQRPVHGQDNGPAGLEQAANRPG